ncbi:hypothetical protein EWM64_g7763 [Hericium alpestre]|uniref:Uncharacterized protein n=1 Tax=Hericium alpestre TaxID=135208 RepID=A0A4Y9ZQC1_9AGAM|nr:hypothetical protein EWM64_g7763 [Hericium alpestre]
MSAFDPVVVRTLIRNTLPLACQKSFETEWKSAVDQRVKSWLKHRTTAKSSRPQARAQFEWDANVVKYVDHINKLTKAGPSGSFLPNGLPLYGPRFVPPTYRDLTRRQKAPKIDPELTYLKPLHVIHPFYFPEVDSACPVCGSTNYGWEGWNTKGHRDVHGIDKEEYVIGVQFRCDGACQNEHVRVCAENKTRSKEEKVPEPNFNFATTNPVFWQNWELWALPRGMPVFFKHCGVTPELLDLIVEVRPSTTSSGLSENIRQLHMLEHGRAFLKYIQTYRKAHTASWLDYYALKPLASPFESEFGGSSISDEIISEVYLEFTSRSRQGESEEYMRTLHGICISMDATFKVVNKAVIVDNKRRWTTVMKGGITSTINEHTETLIWRMCQSQKNVEMMEALDGYARRCKELNVDPPEITVVDSCCHFRGAILQSLPKTLVVLDVYHLNGRYLAAVVDGMKNPHRSAVSRDVVDCILKMRAAKGKPAEYWSQAEQEQKLEDMYQKWVKKGTVWSAAAQKVHEDQLAHVKKGCLARSRQDIRTDGSRIEGTNRHWNSIMRSHPCGVELFSGLVHDFVHRRNMRIGTARVEGKSVISAADQFLASTGGSHHVHLSDHIAKHWNEALAQVERKANSQTTLTDRPRLPIVNSGETFGLVAPDHVKTAFNGVLEAEAKKHKVILPTKEECELPDDLVELAEQDDPAEVDSQSSAILRSMHIDPSLRLILQSDPAGLTMMTKSHLPKSATVAAGEATNLSITTTVHLPLSSCDRFHDMC